MLSLQDSLTGSIFASQSKQDTFRDSLKQTLLLLADSNKTADHVRAIDAQCRFVGICFYDTFMMLLARVYLGRG